MRHSHEVQVEFGLNLSANVGAVLVAGASAGANYKVTLKWTKASEGQLPRV